ncbi:MAG TPA: hypothetical protein ENJ28_05055 [Gammaproteobacteria bacterium]|nr:hypothetical protein [Gammaproteobacteria bacterium]
MPVEKPSQICTVCELDLPVDAFGWRIMYHQRLTACKKCRNKQAKIDRQQKQFLNYNKFSMMKWSSTK